MQPELFFIAFADLMGWIVRGFMTAMAQEVCGEASAVLWRMLPILILPFAATRAFARHAPLLGLFLIGLELYFVYNRLTVFAQKPLVMAELIGNASLIGLGVLLLLPQRFWRKAIQESSHD